MSPFPCPLFPVGVEFLIELAFLNGRAKLEKYAVRTQIVYESEEP